MECKRNPNHVEKRGPDIVAKVEQTVGVWHIHSDLCSDAGAGPLSSGPAFSTLLLNSVLYCLHHNPNLRVWQS